MKYIIIGRTGTGKTSLLNMLEQRGLKPLITKTTRPIRGPQDTNYMFLSKADADKIPDDDKFLYTIIDDDERIVPEFVSAYISLFDTVPEAVAGGGPIVPVYPAGRPAWMSCFTERPIANTMYLGDRVREFPEGHIPGGGNMAIRRSAVKRYGVFDISLGRVGTSLTGGEESDLFERLRLAEAKYYYTPKAVMYHIIPAEKLSRGYFSRLSYNIGVSQLRRAMFYRRVGRVRVAECGKWVVTAAIAAWFFVTLRWSRADYLILMRCRITRGLWSDVRRGE